MKILPFFMGVALLWSAGCADDAPSNTADAGSDAAAIPLEHPAESVIFDFVNNCVALSLADSISDAPLVVSAADNATSFLLVDDASKASKFFMKASDLGTYLFYDVDGGYLVSDDGPMLRQTELKSDIYEIDDTYVSGAEWHLQFSERASNKYQLQNRKTGQYLGADGLVDSATKAGIITLEPAEGCTEHPEMSLDATGNIEPKTYEDGSLFGYVDTHSHILANFGFGGGGIFHGAPFHRLGVSVAMGSCEPFHAEEGRADLLGSGFGNGSESLDEAALIGLLGNGRLPNPAHATDGWPTYSDWPSERSATHQTQYYKWLERAWMSGLRLMVQHAVTNEVFCELMGNPGFQPTRYSCKDMFNVDRQLLEVRNMERYIDAQSGGPGEGWFRVVESPAQAREVIAEGKLAIILGIEAPNLFDCYLTPHDGSPECTDEYINQKLDEYYAKGIRALFPNHKYDNAFTPGDGHRGIIELGNFVSTGHYSNFTEDCPVVDTVFDKGGVQFGGLNQPRDNYLSPAENELIIFSTNPLKDVLPYLAAIRAPPLEGEWCQKGSLTAAGVTLINGMMARGMIPEIDHLPRRSYLEVFAQLEAANYPAAGTHGNTNSGKLYDLGGVSKAGFSRCADPADPGAMADRFRTHRDAIVAAGGYPAEGFGFDLNGLAGVQGPRFGDDANCPNIQENPIEYPFDSFDGKVTFQQPQMGERVVDFNTEGMIHIGMVAELIQDAQRTGVTDEDMDILFRSAEGYIRMWELAETRSQELNP